MKRILGGYISFFREMLGLPNDGAFLSPPAPLWLLLVLCGLIGSARNVAAAGLSILPGFYNLKPDIIWTMFNFPIHLFLFPAMLLHWQLRRLGYRRLDADAVFSLSFHLQILHLIIPLLDWVGLRLGMSTYYVIGTHPIATEWYSNLLFMTPGIIVAWWLTAYIVGRVLHARLGIAWLPVVLVCLTTFMVILIPTYVIFPTFNTLFSRTFGPYLWSPLQYMFTFPKWFPFWGYGTYFAISALIGLLYYVRHSNQASIRSLFQIKGPMQAHTWLLTFAAARSLLDYAWVPAFRPWQYKLLVLFNYTVYQYTIYLFIPAVAGLILKALSPRRLDNGAVLRESVWIWLVYPAVTIINMLTHSPPTQTIDWFRYIPTFMVHNNYMPVGLLAVVPVLLVFYTRLLIRHSGAEWPKVLGSVAVSLWIVYLLYYQYTLAGFYELHELYGPLAAFGFYTLGFLVALTPFANRFHAAFGERRPWLPRLAMAAAVVCVVLMAAGLLSAVLS